MNNYSIDDEFGTELAAGLTESAARKEAQRLANKRGESVYMYDSSADADGPANIEVKPE